MPTIKLIFNVHYLNFDGMICSNKSFFKQNFEIGKLMQISTGPAADDAHCSLANDDGDFHLPFIT